MNAPLLQFKFQHPFYVTILLDNRDLNPPRLARLCRSGGPRNSEVRFRTNASWAFPEVVYFTNL